MKKILKLFFNILLFSFSVKVLCVTNSIEELFKLGESSLIAGQCKEAVNYYSLIIDSANQDEGWVKDPNNLAQVHFKQGIALLSLEEYQKAHTAFFHIIMHELYYKQWLSLPGNRAHLYFKLGVTSSFLEKYDEALDYYNLIFSSIDLNDLWLKDLNNRVQIYFEWGVALSALGRHEEALSNYGNILKPINKDVPWFLDPSNRAQVYFLHGATLNFLRRYKEATYDFEEILDHQAEYSSWLKNQDNSDMLAQQYQKALALSSSDKYFAQGHTKRLQGNYKEALNDFDRILDPRYQDDQWFQVPSNHAQVLLERGMVLDALKRHKEALDVFKGIISNHMSWLDPENRRMVEQKYHDIWLMTSANASADECFEYGNMMYLQKNYQEAVNGFNKLLTSKKEYKQWLQNPNNAAEFYFKRGLALYKLGESQKALNDFNHIIGPLSAWWNAGTILSLTKKHEGWLQDPNNRANVYWVRGVILSSHIELRYLYEIQEALKDLNKILDYPEQYTEWLQDTQNYTLIYFRRGQILYFLQRYEEALRDFNKVLGATYMQWLRHSSKMMTSIYINKNFYVVPENYSMLVKAWRIVYELIYSTLSGRTSYKEPIYLITTGYEVGPSFPEHLQRALKNKDFNNDTATATAHVYQGLVYGNRQLSNGSYKDFLEVDEDSNQTLQHSMQDYPKWLQNKNNSVPILNPQWLQYSTPNDLAMASIYAEAHIYRGSIYTHMLRDIEAFIDFNEVVENTTQYSQWLQNLNNRALIMLLRQNAALNIEPDFEASNVSIVKLPRFERRQGLKWLNRYRKTIGLDNESLRQIVYILHRNGMGRRLVANLVDYIGNVLGMR